jgi:hypothetical protein
LTHNLCASMMLQQLNSESQRINSQSSMVNPKGVWSWPVKRNSSPTGRSTRTSVNSVEPRVSTGETPGNPRVPVRPIMQNKANLKEVSSLRLQVSSRRAQASNHPPSHSRLCWKTPYGVSRGCRAKQSQFVLRGVWRVVARVFPTWKTGPRRPRHETRHCERGRLCKTNPISRGPVGRSWRVLCETKPKRTR